MFQVIILNLIIKLFLKNKKFENKLNNWSLINIAMSNSTKLISNKVKHEFSYQHI